MALRLRRGTNADRQQITPVEGELIYTTDTKKLYIGDGSTVGGTIVSGISFVVEDPTPQLGGDLDLNNSDIVGTGNIVINGLITADNLTGNFKGSVFGDDSTLLVDGAAGKLNLSVNSIADLSNVDILNPSQGDVLTYNSQNQVWEAKPSSFSQTVAGDIQGSIFADNSTLLVDAVNGILILDYNSIKDFGDVQITNIPQENRGAALVFDPFTAKWVTSFDIPLAADEIQGNFYGDAFGQSGTKILDFALSKVYIGNNNIGDLNNVTVTDPVPGDMLLYDQVTNSWVNGQGTTVAFNTTGDVIGGSVFSQNSTVLVDSITNTLNITNQSIAELRDVFYDPNNTNDQALLIWNVQTGMWGATDGTEILTLPNIKTNVIGSVFADDSSILVDGLTGNIYGTIVGEIRSESITGNLAGSVYSDNSTLLVDGTNNTLHGDFVGTVKGAIESSNVTALTIISEDIRGNFTGSVFSETSTLLVDSVNGKVTIDNNFLGELFDVDTTAAQAGDYLKYNGIEWIAAGGPGELIEADIRGSIFGFDSTLIVDALSNSVVANNLTTDSINLPQSNLEISGIDAQNARITFKAKQSRYYLDLVREDNNQVLRGTSTFCGAIKFTETDINETFTTGFILSFVDRLAIGHHTTSDSSNIDVDGLINIQNGRLTLGNGSTPGTERLDVTGNGTFTGFVQVGRYADGTARDADITSPAEGMIVFNQSTQKYQGYVSDTGLAGGGPSNATAGWVDLY